jgi:uncharacterized membrane protein YfcA
LIAGVPWIELAVGIGAALVAGLVRGFSGFGSAMILTPALSALYGPAIAVPIGLALELLVTVPLLPGSVRLVEWRRIGILCLAAFAAVPLGVWLLLNLPPVVMRVAISAVILGFVAILAFGWRYHGRPTIAATLATGAASGLLNGASGMAGPPVVFYYLSGSAPAPQVRASFIVYFALVDAVSVAMLTVGGAINAVTLVRALWLTPVFLAAAWAGARAFRHASEAFYRRMALIILTAIALASLPF